MLPCVSAFGENLDPSVSRYAYQRRSNWTRHPQIACGPSSQSWANSGYGTANRGKYPTQGVCQDQPAFGRSSLSGLARDESGPSWNGRGGNDFRIEHRRSARARLTRRTTIGGAREPSAYPPMRGHRRVVRALEARRDGSLALATAKVLGDPFVAHEGVSVAW